MHKIHKTLVYFLILTMISSALAFKIVVKAYSNAYDGDIIVWSDQ